MPDLTPAEIEEISILQEAIEDMRRHNERLDRMIAQAARPEPSFKDEPAPEPIARQLERVLLDGKSTQAERRAALVAARKEVAIGAERQREEARLQQMSVGLL